MIPGSIVKPSSSRHSCSGVRSFSSELFLGQLNLPSAALLYSKRNPSPSHTKAFIRSFFLPQNRKIAPVLCGFRSNCCCIHAASPSIPLRRSVYPHYPNVGIMRVILIIFLSSSFPWCALIFSPSKDKDEDNIFILDHTDEQTQIHLLPIRAVQNLQGFHCP